MFEVLFVLLNSFSISSKLIVQGSQALLPLALFLWTLTGLTAIVECLEFEPAQFWGALSCFGYIA